MLTDLLENPNPRADEGPAATPHPRRRRRGAATSAGDPAGVRRATAPDRRARSSSSWRSCCASSTAATPRKARIQVDDASALIELRDALAEAKPEDQGSILEQMHRIEALSRQRGKGDTPPVDRKSPYFGHLRLDEGGKRRDVLIGARSFVEPGGGVQIVDWRNAPVSRLFYRYEEGDAYEERLGDRLVEGEIARAPHGRDRRRRAAAGGGAAGDVLARPAHRRSGARWRRGRRGCRSRATAARVVVVPRGEAGARRRCRRRRRRPRRAASWASTTPARAGPTATCRRSPR